MIGRTFCKLTSILLIINFLVPLTASSKEPKGMKIINNTLDKVLLKKYGSYRPKEILYLKDNLSNGERVDLDNEYFKISYPKCFRVEPTVEDSDNVTIKNSASIDLIRTKGCKLYSSNEEFNRIQLAYPNNMSFVEPAKIEDYEPASNAIYRQMIDVNGATGVVYLEIGVFPKQGSTNELNMVLNAFIACKGKKNEIFRLGSIIAHNNNVIEIIENKKFALPEDFQQIISSFRCRKDR